MTTIMMMVIIVGTALAIGDIAERREKEARPCLELIPERVSPGAQVLVIYNRGGRSARLEKLVLHGKKSQGVVRLGGQVVSPMFLTRVEVGDEISRLADARTLELVWTPLDFNGHQQVLGPVRFGEKCLSGAGRPGRVI